MKPEFAVDGERVIVCDAKTPQGGRWVTMRGRKVLIKGGKFVNGPLAGKTYKPSKKFGTQDLYTIGIKAGSPVSSAGKAALSRVSTNLMKAVEGQSILTQAKALDGLPTNSFITLTPKDGDGLAQHILKTGKGKYMWHDVEGHNAMVHWENYKVGNKENWVEGSGNGQSYTAKGILKEIKEWTGTQNFSYEVKNLSVPESVAKKAKAMTSK